MDSSARHTGNSLPRFRFFFLEKYRPPANITTAFNGSHHVVRWDDPETRFDVASHMLCYQLDIRRQVWTPNLGPGPDPSPSHRGGKLTGREFPVEGEKNLFFHPVMFFPEGLQIKSTNDSLTGEKKQNLLIFMWDLTTEVTP